MSARAESPAENGVIRCIDLHPPVRLLHTMNEGIQPENRIRQDNVPDPEMKILADIHKNSRLRGGGRRVAAPTTAQTDAEIARKDPFRAETMEGARRS